MLFKIVILGDFNPMYSTHHALNTSISQVQKIFDVETQFDWISTDVFNYKAAFKDTYCGLWIAPGSPYKDMENVIQTIRYARENYVPTLGNCGGFQHMILEFAKNVCGIIDAAHEEIKPESSELVVSKLACSLMEEEEELTIIDENSILHDILKSEHFAGRYFCNYGINGRYIDIFKLNGLKPTAISAGMEIRAFEIANHPFYIGTLFQPALTSTYDFPNPIILRFVKEAIMSSKAKTSL